MSDYPYYHGTGEERPGAWQDLPVLNFEALNAPAGYMAGDDLRAAVNVTLALGQPLLLTGEPGTGKTQLADSVAHELGLGRALKFETKSTAEARDLFYVYDTVGRFHAAQTPGREADPVGFIDYQALGQALIYANEPNAVKHLMRPDDVHPGRRRSVVLIDEIDKAPRDVPNDILNEIEAMYFRIPELGSRAKVTAPAAWRPIVIFTSNSERALPDAFLRRCVYYHIDFPDEAQLRRIVESRVGSRFRDTPGLAGEAIALFLFLREPRHNLRKPPGTAELLNWLNALANYAGAPPRRLRDHPGLMRTLRYTLLKTREDQALADDLIASWPRGGGSAR